MTILLCGGPSLDALAAAQLRLARALDATKPARVGVLGDASAVQLPAPLAVVPLPAVPEPGDVLGLAALFVPDGDAAQQLRALGSVMSDLRGLIHRGASYLGIGSGAAIASEVALLGGNRLGGVPVAPAAAAGIDADLHAGAELELAPGIGLIDITVLPDAAATGRVGAAVALCEAGVLDRALCLDDGAVFIVADGELDFEGDGCMWQVAATDAGVQVRTNRAGA